MRPLKISIQEYNLIILMLLIASVVVETRAPYFFMYAFWNLERILERATLNNILSMNTPRPDKNENPRYWKRSVKQSVMVNGKVHTDGS